MSEGIKRAYREQSDEELMMALRRRDAHAFSELYERYSERMLNYFHKMLWKDDEKAQDFMQDLFTKLIEKPQLFDSGRSFKTWLYSIAHNMCKNEYRKQGVRTEAHQEIRHSQSESSAGETVQQIDRSTFAKELDSALSELDEVKKTTFLMRFQDEMSVKEISEAMDCSEGTVKSRLFYTIRLLNERLKIYEGLVALLTLLKLM